MAKMTTAQVEAKAKEMGITLTSGTYASIAGKHGSSPAAVEQSLKAAAARTSVAQSTQPAAASTAVSSGSGGGIDTRFRNNVSEVWVGKYGSPPSEADIQRMWDVDEAGGNLKGIEDAIRAGIFAPGVSKVTNPADIRRSDGDWFTQLGDDTISSIQENPMAAAALAAVAIAVTGGLAGVAMPGFLGGSLAGGLTEGLVAGTALSGAGVVVDAAIYGAAIGAVAKGDYKKAAALVGVNALPFIIDAATSYVSGTAAAAEPGAEALGQAALDGSSGVPAATPGGIKGLTYAASTGGNAATAGTSNGIWATLFGANSGYVGPALKIAGVGMMAYGALHGGEEKGGGSTGGNTGTEGTPEFEYPGYEGLSGAGVGNYSDMMSQSYGSYQQVLDALRQQSLQTASDNLKAMYGTPDGIASLALVSALGATGTLNAASAWELNKAMAAVYPTYYTDVAIPTILAQRRSASLGEAYANEVVPALLQNTALLSNAGLADTYQALADPRYKAAAESLISALPGTVDDRIATQRVAEQRALQQMAQGAQASRMLEMASPAIMATGINERATLAGLANRELRGSDYTQRIEQEGDAMVSRSVSIEEQVSESARSLLAGEVPSDVAANVERQTAERMGGRSPQVAANMLAKNLGLTSLDMMNQGQQMAQTASGLRSQTPALGLQLWANRQAPITSYTNLVQAGSNVAGQLPALSDALSAAAMAPYTQALGLAADAAAYGSAAPAAIQQAYAPYDMRARLVQNGMALTPAMDNAFASVMAGLQRPAATGASALQIMQGLMPELASPTGLYSGMLNLTTGLGTISPQAIMQTGAGLSTNAAELAFRNLAQQRDISTQIYGLGLQTEMEKYGMMLAATTGERNANRISDSYDRLAQAQTQAGWMNFGAGLLGLGS